MSVALLLAITTIAAFPPLSPAQRAALDQVMDSAPLALDSGARALLENIRSAPVDKNLNRPAISNLKVRDLLADPAANRGAIIEIEGVLHEYEPFAFGDRAVEAWSISSSDDAGGVGWIVLSPRTPDDADPIESGELVQTTARFLRLYQDDSDTDRPIRLVAVGVRPAPVRSVAPEWIAQGLMAVVTTLLLVLLAIRMTLRGGAARERRFRARPSSQPSESAAAGLEYDYALPADDADALAELRRRANDFNTDHEDE